MGEKERERQDRKREKGKERRGETMYRPAIRRSRRGLHSGRLQRRASIGSLSPTERDPHMQAIVLAAAPTDAGLLQSVELSGELIFQRSQRRDGMSWHRPPPPLPPPPPATTTTTSTSLHVDVRGGPREPRSLRISSSSPFL